MITVRARPWIVAAVAVCAMACERAAETAPPTTIALGTGGPDSVFYALGSALGRAWNGHIPNLNVRVELGGSAVNVPAIEAGTVDVGLTQADIAYAAFSRGADRAGPHQIRGIAIMWENTVHVAVPKDSPVRTIGQLRGRRLSVSAETFPHIVFEAHGLSGISPEPRLLSFGDTVEQMRAGQIDASFIIGGFPNGIVAELSERPGVRLLPISGDRLAIMRAQYPFLQPLIVPRGTYRGVDQDVETIGVSTLLVCRDDLDERLVYQMTKALFDSLPELEAAHRAARRIDPEQAPTTPIPLHPGAARYYREREITR